MAELAVTGENLESERLGVSQQAAKTAEERKALEDLRGQLLQQTQELARKEADLQEMQEQAHVLATQAAQTQLHLKAELAALEVEKETFGQQAQALAERVRLFESKQRQAREQMQQLFAAS